MLGLRLVALAHRIEESRELSVWLHQRTNDTTFSAGEWTGLSILQLTEDIADAIVVLLEAGLPGPALSLARPLFEGYVRGFWLLNHASEQQVSEFTNGKCPNFPGLLAAIPNVPESGGAWIHANSSVNLVKLHDLTHGGSEHVKRRMRDSSVQPNYPEQELEALLTFGNEIRIRVGAELLSRQNDEEGMTQLNERAQALRTEP